MYGAAIVQKEKTEMILGELLKNQSEIVFLKDHVKSTPVKIEGRNLLDIYYRKDAIRINILQNSRQYNVYKQLLCEGLAFQKDTADPKSTDGVFAFFVKEENVKEVLKRLLLY